MITPNKAQAPSFYSRIFSPFSHSLQRTKVKFQLQHLQLSKITQLHNICVYQRGTGLYTTNVKNTRRQFQESREGDQNSESEIEKLIQQILEPQQVKPLECTILNAMLFPRVQAYQIEQTKKPRQQRDENQKNKKQSKANQNQELYFTLKNEQLTRQNRLLSDVLKPGVFLNLEQPLPDSVIEDYNRIKTFTRDNKQSQNIHFVQGYLTGIDCLYYVIENAVHLHQPRGPNNNHLSSTPTTRVLFEEIVYSIIQTEIAVDQLSIASKKVKNKTKNNQTNNYKQQTVLIFCHPYAIQLYCLANYLHSNDKTKQNKPIGKLNVRYSLPNLSQPKHLHVSGSYILYMPDNSSYILTHLCLITGETRNISIKPSITNYLYNAPDQHLRNNCHEKQTQSMRISNHLLRNFYSNIFNHNHSTWVSKLIDKFAVENQMHQMIGCHGGKLIVCLIQIRVKPMFYNLMNLKQSQRSRKAVRVFVRQQFGQYTCEDIYYNAEQEQILRILLIRQKKLDDDKICDNKCSCIIRIVIWSYATKAINIRDYSINKQSKNNFPIIGQQVCKINCSGFVEGNKQYYTIALSQHYKSTFQQLFVFAFFQNEKVILLRTTLSDPKNNNQLRTPECKQSKDMLKFQNFNNKNEFVLLIPVGNLKEKHLYVSNEGTITIATDHGYFRLNELRTTDCIYSTIYNQCLISEKQKQVSLFHLSQVLLSYVDKSHLLMSLTYLISKMMAVCVGSILEKSHGNGCISTLLLWKYGKGSTIFKSIKYDLNSSKTNESIRKICLNLLLYLIADFKNIISPINCAPQNFRQFIQQICYDDRFIQQNPFVNNKSTYFQTQREQQSIKCEHGRAGLKNQKNNNKRFDLKNMQNISNGILKVGFCLNLTNLVCQIWNQPITYISVDKVRNTLQKLDSLRDICIAIGSSGFEEIVKQDTSWSHNKKLILSPTSTVAHSSMSDSQRICSRKLSSPVMWTKNSLLEYQQWINRVTQLIICSQIIKDDLQKSNASMTFRKLYFRTKINKISKQIEGNLFNQFVSDFDPGLLKQWDKLIPSFLASQSIILETKCKKLIEIKPLRFWLNIFTQICGITSKLKILKVLSEHLSKFKLVKWPVNQLFDIESLEFQLSENSDSLKLDCEKTLLPIPMFFINYLSKQKRIQFCDFHLITSDLSQSSSKYPYTNSHFPYCKSSTQPFQSGQRTFHQQGMQQVLQVQNFEVKQNKGQNLNEQLKQDLQFSKIILPKTASYQKKNKESQKMQKGQQDVKPIGLKLEQVIEKTAHSLNQ